MKEQLKKVRRRIGGKELKSLINIKPYDQQIFIELDRIVAKKTLHFSFAERFGCGGESR